MEGMTNVINLAHEMGIQSNLARGLATAMGGSDVTLKEHVQGYQVFANQGQKIERNVIKSIDDGNSKTVYTHDLTGGQTVLSPAESYLLTDVLKQYQYQWGFGWNRQMASKTGTSDNGHGQIPDSWIMAYNSDIVAGVWVGNTAPNGGGGMIRAFGESVGQTIMARFPHPLPTNLPAPHTPPSGIVRGCGAQSQEIFLIGPQASC